MGYFTCESNGINVENNLKKNNGQCFDNNGQQKFSCNCVYPFAGERCEINICENVECLNGGQCIQDPNIKSVIAPMCDCPADFGGETCEIDLLNYINLGK